MEIFRPCANVVGDGNNTQFGRKFRILPTLHASYIMQATTASDMENDAVQQVLKQDEPITQSQHEELHGMLGVKMAAKIMVGVGPDKQVREAPGPQ